MAFRYTKPRVTQHLLLTGILLSCVAAASTAAGAEAWARWVEQRSYWTLLVAAPFALHMLAFWPAALCFHYVDTQDRPASIARRRIRTGPAKKPPLRRVLPLLALNQLLLSPLLLAGMALALKARGWAPSPMWPSLPTLILELLGLTACSMLIFYSSHRFLHRPWWMKRVHRVHHEFRTSTALASEYAHPVEFIVGNFGTMAGGVLLLAPSLAAIYLYTVLGVLTVLFHHCGYALPWAPWGVHHHWHHHRFTEIFGTLGWIDRLLGTDGSFRDLREAPEAERAEG